MTGKPSRSESPDLTAQAVSWLYSKGREGKIKAEETEVLCKEPKKSGKGNQSFLQNSFGGIDLIAVLAQGLRSIRALLARRG